MKKIRFLIILCVFALFLSCVGIDDNKEPCSAISGRCKSQCEEKYEELGYETYEQCDEACYNEYVNCLNERTTGGCFVALLCS